MPDSDHSLDLLIRTKADLAGAKAAAAELERGIARAKFMGKEYAGMQAQLDKVNTALAAHAKGNQEAGEKTRPFAHHMGEVKKSIRELSHEFPIAAQALRLLTNPVGGALAIAIGMFALAKQKLDDWNKEMDETAEVLRKADFADAIKARKEALESGEVAMATYADKMAHLIDPEEAFQKQITAQIALLHARNEAQGKVADANYGLEEARLKHSQSLEEAALKKQLDDGKISAEAFNQAKLALDAAYFARLTQMEQEHEQAKLAREKQLREDEIKKQEEAAKRAFEAQPGLDKTAKEAREKATRTAGLVAHDEGDVATAAAAKDANAKAVDDLEKELAAMESKIKLAKAAGTLLPGSVGYGIVAGLNLQKRGIEEKLDTARGTQEGDFKLGERAGGRLKTEKPALAVENETAGRAEGAAQANKTRTNDLNQALLASRDKNTIENATATATTQADAGKRLLGLRDKEGGAGIGGGFTVGDETRYDELVHLQASGHKLNTEQLKFTQNFGSFIQQQLAWHTDIGPLLLRNAQEAAKSNGDMAVVLQNVVKELEILRGRIKGIQLK